MQFFRVVEQRIARIGITLERAAPSLTSSSAAILSSSLSSLSAEAMVGGVEAGRGFSEMALLSFTWGFGPSVSSESDFCTDKPGRIKGRTGNQLHKRILIFYHYHCCEV